MEWKLQAVHGRAWLVHLKRFHWVYFSLSCFLFFSTSWLLTTGFFLSYTFFLHFHSFSVFKVFIHFSFIPHSSMFLIFLPHPLYSRLQHPAMQTQPVLKGSELLKPLLPFPLCRSGPQRKVGGGTEGGIRGDERNGDGRFVRRHDGFGVQRNLILFTSLLHGTVHVVGEARESIM